MVDYIIDAFTLYATWVYDTEMRGKDVYGWILSLGKGYSEMTKAGCV